MKKMLIPGLLIAALAMPLAHALPAPGNGPGNGQGMGPGAYRSFDRPPMEQVRPDCPRPMWGHHHGPKMGKHYAPLVRTFGMDEVRAKQFFDRMAHHLRVDAAQKKAWDGMQKSYLAMVNSHKEWRGERVKDAKPLPPQKRLEMRAQRLENQARLLKDFAKQRAALEKVMKPEQMRDFDRLMATGKVNMVPPPALKK